MKTYDDAIKFQVKHKGKDYWIYIYKTLVKETNDVMFSVDSVNMDEDDLDKYRLTKDECYFHIINILWQMADERLAERESKVEKNV